MVLFQRPAPRSKRRSKRRIRLDGRRSPFTSRSGRGQCRSSRGWRGLGGIRRRDGSRHRFRRCGPAPTSTRAPLTISPVTASGVSNDARGTRSGRTLRDGRDRRDEHGTPGREKGPHVVQLDVRPAGRALRPRGDPLAWSNLLAVRSVVAVGHGLVLAGGAGRHPVPSPHINHQASRTKHRILHRSRT